MFIARYQGVFRSRWRALMWALGVCLTAYCTVPSADQDNGDLIPGLTGGSHAKATGDRPTDPWALDKPEQSKS